LAQATPPAHANVHVVAVVVADPPNDDDDDDGQNRWPTNDAHEQQQLRPRQQHDDDDDDAHDVPKDVAGCEIDVASVAVAAVAGDVAAVIVAVVAAVPTTVVAAGVAAAAVGADYLPPMNANWAHIATTFVSAADECCTCVLLHVDCPCNRCHCDTIRVPAT